MGLFQPRRRPAREGGQALTAPATAPPRLRTLDALPVAGRRVLMRVDFNVPLAGVEVSSDHRLRESLPGILTVLQRGGTAICCSHLGRPKGRDAALSMAPVARRLTELLGRPVIELGGCDEPAVRDRARALPAGSVALTENLRWYPGEQRGDLAFARALASLADCYVDDAFGTAHRSDASVAIVPTLLPSAAGPLLAREIDVIEGLLADPPRPFLAILGGAKVDDKLPVIDRLLPLVDVLAIGGGMAYTFLAAQGVAVGDSLVAVTDRESARDNCAARLARARDRGVTVILPVDHACHVAFEDTDAPRVIEGPIPAGWRGLDIGPVTAAQICDAVARAGAVIWNGPLGVFEWPAFAHGTRTVAEAMAASRARTIVGGGDTAAAVEQFGVAERLTHVSTGGGASLALLAGETMPGVEPLRLPGRDAPRTRA